MFLGVLIDFLAPSFGFVVLGPIGPRNGVGLPSSSFNIILEQVPKRKIGLMMGWDPDPHVSLLHWTYCRWSLDG